MDRGGFIFCEVRFFRRYHGFFPQNGMFFPLITQIFFADARG
jgi:hypothetical protein